ncbi:hypothetical protein NDU88_013000, partial [Pleurodeles waltl]
SKYDTHPGQGVSTAGSKVPTHTSSRVWVPKNGPSDIAMNEPPEPGGHFHKADLLCLPQPPPAAVTVEGTSTATAPDPSTAPPAGQPTAMVTTWPHTSSAGTQTTPAAAIDPAAFGQMQRKLDRVLKKMSQLQQE